MWEGGDNSPESGEEMVSKGRKQKLGRIKDSLGMLKQNKGISQKNTYPQGMRTSAHSLGGEQEVLMSACGYRGTMLL